MFKWLLTLVVILIVVSCGANSGAPIAGVDIPDDNNSPVAQVTPPVSSPATVAAEIPSNNEVKSFGAPLVLIRGVIAQSATDMNSSL